MIEGLEKDESFICSFCFQFGAIESIWRELTYSDASEII